MSTPDQDPDQSRIYRALEAILLSPVTGRAVARTLLSQATEPESGAVVSDIRTRSTERACQKNAEARDEAGRSSGSTSPWAQLG